MFQLRDNCTTSSRRTRASRYNWSGSKRALGFNKKIWHTPGSYFFFTPLSFFSFFLLFLPRNYFYTRGRQWVKILCVKRGARKGGGEVRAAYWYSKRNSRLLLQGIAALVFCRGVKVIYCVAQRLWLGIRKFPRERKDRVIVEQARFVAFEKQCRACFDAVEASSN